MTGFGIYIRMQLWKRTKYSRTADMSGFCIMQAMHKVLDMPEYD